MGLAEQTDALTFVVSEERGMVSIFSGGQARSAVDPAVVEAAVLDH